jgi:CPA2 family monovalent cation:H+ antiporter-2
MFPVIIAVSAVTALTTPYLILSAERVGAWLDHLVPERVHLLLLRYEVAMNESLGRENVMRLLWRAHGLTILLNSVVLIGIGLGGILVFGPLMAPHELTGGTITMSIGAALIALPFFAAIFRSPPPRHGFYDSETRDRLNQLKLGVSIVRFLVGTILAVFVTSSILGFPTAAGLIATLAIIGTIFLFGHWIDLLYYKVESLFITNLDKERAVVEERSTLPHLAPWEATLTEFTVSEYSPLVMQTVQSSHLKQQFGVTVAIIRRGEKTIVAPQSDEKLLPCDRLYLIGDYEQLSLAQAVIELRPDHEEEIHIDDHRFGMMPIRLNTDNPLVGKTIRDCGIRDIVKGLIVGVERQGSRHLNPSPGMKLHAGDVLWLVGEKELISKLRYY